MRSNLLSVLLASLAATSATAADETVAKPPPAASIYTVEHRYLEAPDKSTPGPSATPAVDPEMQGLLPAPAKSEIHREVEYTIAGKTAAMQIRERGKLAAAHYFGGPFTIIESVGSARPRVEHSVGNLEQAAHFISAYPGTRAFLPAHFKARVLIADKPALLYEIPAGEDPADLLAKTPGKASAEVAGGLKSPGSAYLELEARRLWVDEGTRLPIALQTRDELVRYVQKGPAPPAVQLPAECKDAMNKYIESTRVRRAKPY